MARHRAPGRARFITGRPERRALTTAAAIAAAAIGVSGAGLGVSTTSFGDQFRAVAAATTYTVPAPAAAGPEVSGTGEFISSRMKATCADPSQLAWRWRDHMVAWGEVWNGWSEWSTSTSEPGWTGWSTSQLIHVGMPAEVQWQIRCGVELWTGPEVQSPAAAVVRTT